MRTTDPEGYFFFRLSPVYYPSVISSLIRLLFEPMILQRYYHPFTKLRQCPMICCIGLLESSILFSIILCASRMSHIFLENSRSQSNDQVLFQKVLLASKLFQIAKSACVALVYSLRRPGLHIQVILINICGIISQIFLSQ